MTQPCACEECQYHRAHLHTPDSIWYAAPKKTPAEAGVITWLDGSKTYKREDLVGAYDAKPAAQVEGRYLRSAKYVSGLDLFDRGLFDGFLIALGFFMAAILLTLLGFGLFFTLDPAARGF